MNKSDQINELAAALAKAQGEFKGALKDSANPFFKSKYADLASVWDACRAALSKHNLCIIQGDAVIDPASGRWIMETLLSHSSGQWVMTAHPILVKDESAQAFGSGETYARRYALQAMLGICPEDDDGNDATHKGLPATTQAQTSIHTRPAPAPVRPVAPAAKTGLKPLSPSQAALSESGDMPW